MPSEVILMDEQRKKLTHLWLHVYGNNGPKHTHHNHRFIQNFLEHGEDTEAFYRKANKSRIKKAGIDWKTVGLTDECVRAVREVLNG
jgi:hypothetical protein